MSFEELDLFSYRTFNFSQSSNVVSGLILLASSLSRVRNSFRRTFGSHNHCRLWILLSDRFFNLLWMFGGVGFGQHCCWPVLCLFRLLFWISLRSSTVDGSSSNLLGYHLLMIGVVVVPCNPDTGQIIRSRSRALESNLRNFST